VEVGPLAERDGSRVSVLGPPAKVSGHTARSLHLQPACAVPDVRHLGYFADHERVERLLFDGVAEPIGGVLHPDCWRPGHGLALERPDAARWLVAGRAGG